MRDIIVAGNWKMNTIPWEGVELARSIAVALEGMDSPCVVVCPPATHLFLVQNSLMNTNVEVGAQNIHWDKSGAYTGEVSAEMLLALGIKWAIIGHSERRQYFGETDETVNKRARRAVEAGIRPIVCIGESLEERETGQTFTVLERQLQNCLLDLPMTGSKSVVIAYEPVWAIGTGRTATPDQAEEAHAFIRSKISLLKGSDVALNTVIQYGGSVNEANAHQLMACPNVDGALVGGASLVLTKFKAIIEAARRK